MGLLEFGLDVLLGVVLGTLGGLFGIGGGLIAIPVIGVVFGIDQQLAQGTALVMVVPNVVLAIWRYNQRNRITGVMHWRSASQACVWPTSAPPSRFRSMRC